MNPQNPIALKIHQNAMLVCDAPRCAHLRRGASNYCLHHKWANRQHGHPLGRHVFPHEYAQERRDVAKLFRAQSEHPALLSALAFVSSWTALARAGGRVPAAAEMARLASSGVRAQQILEETAAVWSFAHANPRTLPDDRRLDFAMATAVFNLAPRKVLRQYTYGDGKVRRRYPAISRDDKRDAGRYIRDNLKMFLQHTALANTADPRLDVLRQGFAIPFSNLTIPT